MTETKLNGLIIHNIDSKETYDALVAAGKIGENDLALVKEDASAFNLGITGASVGDIIKVKAVDDSGKPTAWDSYSDQFELLRTITITESTNAVSITQDENGDMFSLSDVFIYCDNMIGQGLNYAAITYSDNNNLTLTVSNALNAARVTQIVAKNEGGFYRNEGLWAASDGERNGSWYRLVTAKSFEPISSVTLSFGAAVTRGRIRLWGIRI